METEIGDTTPETEVDAPVGNMASVVINEFEPNPAGSDPATTSVELLGAAGTTFDGWLLSLENDGANGLVDSADAVSGTFDANGLLVVDIPDLENPSFTLVLTDSFTGAAGSTDIDTDDDGTPDDLSALGAVLDAVSVSDATADDATLYGAALGGENILFNGEFEPLTVFRDGTTGELFNTVTVDFGTPDERIGVFDASGAAVDPAAFDTDPTTGPTYGAVNPSLGAAPLVGALINEFQANPPGADPSTVQFELLGEAGAAFEGWLISIESDPTSVGTIDRAAQVSGTFDANGLLVVDIPDLENPSFTVALVSDFTGSVGDDLDADDDGVADQNLDSLGVVFDAIGLPDATGDEAFLYGAQLGGTDFAFTGSEPELVFRDGATGELFAVNDIDPSPSIEAFRTDGTAVPVAQFDTDPSDGPTFDAVNPALGDPVSTFADVLISAIQGATDLAEGTLVGVSGAADESPLLGQAVRIEGVVTQYLPDLGGFYVQEEDSDADDDSASSEGIFVQSDFVPTGALGTQLVSVEGTVAEIDGETTLVASGVTDTGTVSEGTVTATAVSFPTATVLQDADGDFVANLEAYEGMLVSVTSELFVTELFQLDRFGTIRLSEGAPLEQFTQNSDPDVAGFQQNQRDAAARSLVIDDGTGAQNPSPILVPGLGDDGTLDNGDVFRMGDSYTGLTGVLSYSEDPTGSEEPEYRIHLPEGTLNQNNPRPTEVEDLGSDYRVASLNVLNFFSTLDEFPSVGEGSGPNGLEPRGADTNPQAAAGDPGPLEEFDRQLAKLVEQISLLDADVIGLVELENDFAEGGASPTGSGLSVGSGVAIQELVDAVNASLGSVVYDWVRPAGQTTTTGEFVGGDAIAVGFIYDITTTGLVGDAAVLDTVAFTDPTDTGTGKNRAALAQTFEELATGGEFTAAINHFKSKGASGLDAGDASNPDSDQGDGAGFWNEARTLAAIELANWLASNPTGSDDPDTLILGDLNAYQQEDPIKALEAAGYTDLAEAFIANPYSFVFDGQRGTLDYALASGTLTGQVTGVQEVHLNADEADALDYNLEFGRDPGLFSPDAYRASDHDPVVIGLDLDGDDDGDDLTVIAGDPDAENKLIGTPGQDSITGGSEGDVIRARGDNDIVEGGDGRNFLFGDEGDDIVSGGADADNLYGGDDDDDLFGFAGDDRLEGGDGNDELDGGADNDRLFAGAGEDFVFAGDGDDIIGLSTGTDRVGDGDADILSVDDADGTDRVFGFETGLDAIILNGATTDFELSAGAGNNTVLTYGDTRIVFVDALVTADDFLFV